MTKLENGITIKPFIDEEYLKLVPRLSKEQRHSLKMSIKEEGQLVPILVNSKGKILDGHTRFEICHELNIEPIFTVKDFDNTIEEKMYVITSNLKRRQLNTFQIYELIETQRNEMITERRKIQNQKMWDTRKGKKDPEPRDEKYTSSTDYRFSQITGLGVGQIESSAYVKRHADEKLLNNVRDGTLTVNQARTILMNRNNFKPNTEPKPERLLPPCNLCGGKVRTRRNCHVHKEYCCINCEGGK